MARLFELIAKFYGKSPEDISFNFVSDEFNGVNRDSTNVIRPRLCRDFTLARAIVENGVSRVYLGVHWNFDDTGGRELGKKVAEKVYSYFKEPKPETTAAAAPAAAPKAAPAPLPATRRPFR